MPAPAAPPLETRRLLLRPVAPEDDAALHALFCDPFVYRFLFDGRAPEASASAALLADCREACERQGLALYVLRLRGSGALAGFCGLRPLEADDAAELLFGLAPAFAGHGLAREAATACLHHAFRSLGLARVVAGADAPNRASLRLLEALGMRRTGSHPGALGEIHDHVLEAAEHRLRDPLQAGPRSADPPR